MGLDVRQVLVDRVSSNFQVYNQNQDSAELDEDVTDIIKDAAVDLDTPLGDRELKEVADALHNKFYGCVDLFFPGLVG